MYIQRDLFRNVVGHTYMEPDALHRSVTQAGKSQGQVASTAEWCRFARSVMSHGKPLDAEVADQSYFYLFGAYLRQMYIPRKRHVCQVGGAENNLAFHRDYRWANFGAGYRSVNGVKTYEYHPYEVWLRKCDNQDCDDWWQEEPVRVCYGRHMNTDGTLHANCETFWEWYARAEVAAGRDLEMMPLADFEAYDGPLEVERAKAWDLHKLSRTLKPHEQLTQEQIDELYPEPEGPEPELEPEPEPDEQSSSSDESE